MKLRYNILFIILLLIIQSCDYVDVSGTFLSLYRINERFAELDSLPETTFDNTVDSDNFSFLIISDCHYYKENAGHIAKIANDSRFSDICMLYLNGDNVQSGQQYQYDYLLEDLESINVPVYAGLGNHDLYNGGYTLFKKYFGRTAYVLHIGCIDLFVMDTANGIIGTAQRKWIEKQLKQSKAKYKIITTHCALIDKEYVSPCTYSFDDDIDYMFNLLDEENVDCFIGGHLHEYDDCTVRGVRYIKIYNQAQPDLKYAKVTVKNGILDIKVY